MGVVIDELRDRLVDSNEVEEVLESAKLVSMETILLLCDSVGVV